jgi:hypothetical protein
MRSLRLPVVVCVTLACGGTATPPATTADAPAQAPEDVTPAMVDRSSPAAAARAYLEAALTNRHGDMLAVMTPECRDREKSWDKGFTRNIVDGKIQLKSYELREPEVTGDTAKVSARAIFVVDGADDNEGVRFALRQEADGWLITEIR